MLEALLPIALKVLGCAVGIYILAGFLVSLTRLLPVFAIASSAATLQMLYYIRTEGDETMLWIPIVLTLATQLFYQGENFMNPRIHENLYNLVSVERKWTSLFAEFDTYRLYFRPVETGGFVENTLIFGIAFGAYYEFLAFRDLDRWFVYILPLYFLVMSVIDLLMSIRILKLHSFFYGALRILVCILVVTVCFLAPFGEKDPLASTKKRLYEQGKEISTVDFDNTSYVAYYEWVYYSGTSKYTQEELSYVYDSVRDLGAVFTTQATKRYYDTLYTKLPEYGDRYVVLQNQNYNENEWIYNGPATEREGAMKFSSLEMPDFLSCIVFDKTKVYEAFQLHNRVNDNYYVIQYESEYDETYDKENGPRYRVLYTYTTDDDGNLLALTRIECEIHVDDKNMHSLILYPNPSSTGVDELYEGDSLKGYTYNPDILYGLNFSDYLDLYNGTEKSIADYDFLLTERADGVDKLYAYDHSAQLVGIYTDNYSLGLEELSDFDKRPCHPDYYISNTYRAIYDKELNLLSHIPNEAYFEKWTFSDKTARTFIENVFAIDFDGTIEVQDEGGTWIFVTLTKWNDALGTTVTYTFNVAHFGEFFILQYLEARATYQGREYYIRVRSDDDYSVDASLTPPPEFQQ